MKICKSIEEGVASVMDVYGYKTDKTWKYVPATGDDLCDKLVIDGVEYPFFWWRTDVQIALMTKMAPARKPCSMKLNRSCSKSEGLERLLYRELDIAERMMGSSIAKLMCFRNQNAMNMIATMENERVAIFELAAALNEKTEEQGRHTYWGQDGMASDKVVSQKVTSDSIYLFTEDEETPKTYNDIFIYMYGLSRTDATKASAIIDVLLGKTDINEWKEKDEHIRRCIEAAVRSCETESRITVSKE